MQSPPSFTGRSRRRTTHRWVKASDRIARLVITLGGISTIAAVLAVGVFLLAVAAPLFTGATAALDRVAPLPEGRSLAVGVDESGGVAWLLDGAGDDHGRIAVVGLADGAVLLDRPASETGLADCTAVRTTTGGMLAAVGFADGSFRTGRIGLDAVYESADGLRPDQLPARVGGAVTIDNAVIVRLPGERFSRVSLVAELGGPPAEPLGGRIIDLDVVPLTGGPLVAAVDDAGGVRIEKVTTKKNMLTGKLTATPRGTTIAPIEGFRPRFIRVSALGDQLFLIAADGAARRYLIRNLDAPQMMEAFTAAAGDAGVTAVERLFGGVSLAVGDAAGRVRILFATRGESDDRAEPAAADGLRMVVARTFEPRRSTEPAGIVALAASPRSRLFAASDAAGGVRLLQSTTGMEVLEAPALRSTADAAPAMVAEQLC